MPRSRRLRRPQASARAEASSTPQGSRVAAALQLLAHDIAEALRRLRGLKPGVEVDGRAHALVAKDTAGPLVVSRIRPQDQGRGRVPVLMGRYPDPNPVFDKVRDLVAEHVRRLVGPVLAREEPK